MCDLWTVTVVKIVIGLELLNWNKNIIESMWQLGLPKAGDPFYLHKLKVNVLLALTSVKLEK